MKAGYAVASRGGKAEEGGGRSRHDEDTVVEHLGD